MDNIIVYTIIAVISLLTIVRVIEMFNGKEKKTSCGCGCAAGKCHSKE